MSGHPGANGPARPDRAAPTASDENQMFRLMVESVTDYAIFRSIATPASPPRYLVTAQGHGYRLEG